MEGDMIKVGRAGCFFFGMWWEFVCWKLSSSREFLYTLFFGWFSFASSLRLHLNILVLVHHLLCTVHHDFFVYPSCLFLWVTFPFYPKLEFLLMGSVFQDTFDFEPFFVFYFWRWSGVVGSMCFRFDVW